MLTLLLLFPIDLLQIHRDFVRSAYETDDYMVCSVWEDPCVFNTDAYPLSYTADGCQTADKSRQVVWDQYWRSPVAGKPFACGAELSLHQTDLRMYYCDTNGQNAEAVDVVGVVQSPVPVREGVYGRCLPGQIIAAWTMYASTDDTQHSFKFYCKNPKMKDDPDDTVRNGVWVPSRWLYGYEESDYGTPLDHFAGYLDGQQYLHEIQLAMSHSDNASPTVVDIRGKYVNYDYGVSNAKVKGYWTSIGSGPNLEYKAKEIVTSHEMMSLEESEQVAYALKISSGVDFRIWSASVELTKEVSQSVSYAVESSLTLQQEEWFTVKCDEIMGKTSPTGYWYAWQFRLYQPNQVSNSGVERPGFALQSHHVRCSSVFLPPACPVGYCKDLDCQTCVDTIGSEPKEAVDTKGDPADIYSTLSPTASPTPLPTERPTDATTAAPVEPSTPTSGSGQDEEEQPQMTLEDECFEMMKGDCSCTQTSTCWNKKSVPDICMAYLNDLNSKFRFYCKSQ